MGNSVTEQQIGTPIDNHLLALIITDQTERVIEKLKDDPSKFYMSEEINFRGDNILHYACARNNVKLVEYLVKANPELASKHNHMNQAPG